MTNTAARAAREPLVENLGDLDLRLPAAPLSERARTFWARWSIKFTAEYYEPTERGESAKSRAEG